MKLSNVPFSTVGILNINLFYYMSLEALCQRRWQLPTIRYGVPQGSDLGPRFFPLHTRSRMTFPRIICWWHTDLFTSLVLPVPSRMSLECQNLFFFLLRLKTTQKVPQGLSQHPAMLLELSALLFPLIAVVSSVGTRAWQWLKLDVANTSLLLIYVWITSVSESRCQQWNQVQSFAPR